MKGFDDKWIKVPANRRQAAYTNLRPGNYTVELRIADKEEGFSMEFWGDPPDDYGISLQSPAGEKLYVSSSLGAGTQELSFIFVETKVLVNYVKMERMTGKQLIYFRFRCKG